jgi:AraC family transcriptional regulator
MQAQITPSDQMVGVLSNRLHPPIRSSHSLSWKHIVVEEFRQPPGQEKYENLTDHTVCISLNHRPLRLLQAMGNRRLTTPSVKGDICIIPAGSSVFSQWNQEDQYLRIRIAPQLLEQVAQEASEVASDWVELSPELRVRHPQIEQLGMMLLNEIKNNGLAEQLYVESLTNALAVHLLRSYSAIQPCADQYDGGLSDHQLLQVANYVHDCLDRDINLSDLAGLLGISKFHFSRHFKQATGLTPHQYVLQQRLEQAKHLLKKTKLPVMEIAMLCGFSNHSHLGKVIRQHTGLSPKAYRISQGI